MTIFEFFDTLDERSKDDPRLNQYRFSAGEFKALDSIPDGWYMSETMNQLAERGGWWPGVWGGYEQANYEFSLLELFGLEASQTVPTVIHLIFGSIFEEHDYFYTPLCRTRFESAPLLFSSAQSLAVSMVFPTESCLIEAFLTTYDQEGFDDEVGNVNPFFVEWITESDIPISEEHDRLHPYSVVP